MTTRVVDDQAPWIELFGPPEIEQPEMRCARCRSVDRLVLPMDMGLFSRRLRAFMRVHRKCQEHT